MEEAMEEFVQPQLVTPDGALTYDGAIYVSELKQMEETRFSKFLQLLTPGGRFMAAKIHSGDFAPEDLDNGSLPREWAIEKELRQWVKSNPLRASQLDLSAGKLRNLGLRGAWDAERFVALYERVANTNRPWGSCYQPSHGKVKAIALTPRFDPLPLWVKRQMVSADQYIHTDRPGDPWRYVECAKAWRWAPALPKNLAEQVGKHASLKARMVAPIAWMNIADQARMAWSEGTPPWGEEVSRQEAVVQFWKELDRLARSSLVELLEIARETRALSPKMFRVLAEHWCALPHGTLADRWDNRNYPTVGGLTELLQEFGSPKLACTTLLGCAGKATVKAFQKADTMALKWASGLAHGQADLVQKILALGEEEILPYEPDALPLMREWHPKTRLRMLTTLWYRHRGMDYLVSANMVRDTGYMWSQLRRTPHLGRIRCWFSLHELVQNQLVEEQPEERLPVPQTWEAVDGLSAVDGSWELRLPHCASTLKEWGRTLDNCVGGYVGAIKNGRSVVLAVLEGGLVTHAIEVASGEVRQFYAVHNSPPKAEIREEVEDSLRQANLIR
jgi:hypothetical protein